MVKNAKKNNKTIVGKAEIGAVKWSIVLKVIFCRSGQAADDEIKAEGKLSWRRCSC